MSKGVKGLKEILVTSIKITNYPCKMHFKLMMLTCNVFRMILYLIANSLPWTVSDHEGQGHKPLVYKSHFQLLRQFYVETPLRILG